MSIRMTPLAAGLMLAALLSAAPAMAKHQNQGGQSVSGPTGVQTAPSGMPGAVGVQGQGQRVSPYKAQPSVNTQGNRATPYGPPSYSGHKGSQTPPYGPPSYSGHKQKYKSMPPGQQKKAYKHSNKKSYRNGPPDHAPAWGYRNQ